MTELEIAEAKIKEAAQTDATSLDLQGNFRVLPPEIGNLSAVRHLKIYVQLEVLPSEIGQLSALETLNVYGDFLTQVPPEIGNLTNLKELRLEGQFDALPSEIGNLAALEILYLRGIGENLHTLPAEIGSLTQLKEVIIEQANLQSLPAEIGQWRKLEYLRLDRCQLNSLPSTIGNLEVLEVIDVSNNEIQGLPPEIGRLPTLQTLILDGNPLSILPPEIGHLTTLQHLDIDANLEVLPSEIGKLTTLETLKIGGHLALLPPEIGSLTQLKMLVINGGNFESLPPEIGNLTALESLEISSRDVLHTLPPEIGNLSQLKKITIEQANLQSLPTEIGNLSKLEHLQLNGCHLSRLPDTIGKLKALRWLDLQINQLKTLPAEIGKCIALQSLKLANNDLRELPTTIRALENLQDLDVYKNPELAALPEGLQPTGRVNVEGTKIKRLPASYRHAFVRPRVIKFESEPEDKEGHWLLKDGVVALEGEIPADFLEALPRIGHKIRELTMGELYNIETLPIDLGYLEDLKKLILGRIEPVGEPPFTLPSTIRSLKKLKVLEFLSSWLALPPEIGYLEALEEIQLESARIVWPEKLVGGNLPNLREVATGLECHMNDLPDWLGGCPALQVVSLSECSGVTHLPDSFTHHYLIRLAFHRCRDLTTLPTGLSVTRLQILPGTKLDRLPDNLTITGYVDIQGLVNIQIPNNFTHLPLSQHLYVDLDQVTRDGILGEPKVEIQRGMIQALGFERFMALANPEIIDEDVVDGKTRHLLQVPSGEQEPLTLLITTSNEEMLIRQVATNIKTCEEADN